jgi:hypothetical protein
MGRTRCSTVRRTHLADGTPIPEERTEEQLLRDQAIDEAIRVSDAARRARRHLIRSVVDSTFLLTLLVLGIGSGEPGSLLRALFVVGPLLGLALERLPSERFVTGLVGLLAFLACVPGNMALGIWLLFGALPALCVFVTYGSRREARDHVTSM